MSEKIAVVTGGNSGIGYEIVRSLSAKGITVYFGSRDVKKNDEAVMSLKGQPGKVTGLKLDLSNFKSIKDFADSVLSKVDKIDMLINNAGIMALPDRRMSVEGFEMQFATNHLGHFLLTKLLFDKIKKAPASRIVNLSSMAHQFCKTPDIPNLPKAEAYSDAARYSQSKLCNVLFTTRLHTMLKDHCPNVTAFVVHPGAVDTNLYTQNGWAKCFQCCCSCCLKTPEQGSISALHCALADLKTLKPGEYYDSDGSWKEMNPHGRDVKLQAALWELSQKCIGAQFNPK